MKTAIENLSQLMNITLKDFENFVSIIVLNNPENITQALIELHVIQDKTTQDKTTQDKTKLDDVRGYTDFLSSNISKIYNRYDIIDNKFNEAFNLDLPSQLLRKILLFKN